MNPVIQVENLGKKYILSHQQKESYTALRDVLSNGFRQLANKLNFPFVEHQPLTTTSEEFWALRDVSFEVNQGELIGIIGRNGAGKSTLLKILSRITEPTTGRVRIKGRVASLLEVGTGFHPELTGRENIFLNGAILGMSRIEIKKKFEEIVDFAGIEKFLDTPVKRYSSGMYVRLAFAVAAHLEPEILIVDEVLAVGDAQFQKKCLGRMEDVGREGRTVLFVSHNMATIRTLCEKCFLVEQGRISASGTSENVVHEYLKRNLSIDLNGKGAIYHNQELDITLKSLLFLNSRHEATDFLVTGEECTIRFVLSSSQIHSSIIATVGFNSCFDNKRLFICYSPLTNANLRIERGISEIECKLDSMPLIPGVYTITIKLMAGDTQVFYLPLFAKITVSEGDFFGTGRLPDPAWSGDILVAQQWSSRADRGDEK